MAEEQPTPDSPDPVPQPAASPEKQVLEYRSAKVQTLQYSSAAAPINDWTHVYRAGDYLEANLLVAKLQEAGIHARADMENTTALGHWGMSGHGGTNVQVLESEIPEARRIIEEIEKVRAARRAAHEVHCPKCNQHPV